MAGKKLGEVAIEQVTDLIRKVNGEPTLSNKAQRRQRSYTTGSLGVLIYNSTAETIPAYGIMRPVSETTLDTEPVWIVGKQGTEFNRLMLVNGEETLASGAYGTGYFCDRPFRALYDSADGTPGITQHWGAYPSSWKLRKHMYGFYIRGAVDADETTVMVRQELVDRVFGVTDDEIAKGSISGVVSVWKADGSDDSGANVSGVRNPFAIAPADLWCRVVWDGATQRLSAVECAE